MESRASWFKQCFLKSNYQKEIQAYSFEENIYRLKIIAVVGGLVNIGVTQISLFDQNAAVFVKSELYFRLVWIILSIMYFCCATPKVIGQFRRLSRAFMYLTISACLVLAALVSTLPFADHSYVIVFLVNILLIGTLLYLSDVEMLLVTTPSLMVLVGIYLMYPNGILHQQSQMTNVIAITFFAYMMSHVNYAAKVDQWKATNTIKSKNIELHRLSSQDELTGVANRRCINETLDRMIADCVRTGDALCILMVDIDYFKLYNDSKGHLKGDQCLVEVVGILRTLIKEPQDFIGRFGGEEFLILLPLLNQVEAMERAENICQTISQHGIEHEQSPYGHVTVSIGAFVQNGKANIPPMAFIESADAALYQAKLQGRNRAVMSGC